MLYLIKRKSFSYEEALSVVSAARPLADPNGGFRAQLQREAAAVRTGIITTAATATKDHKLDVSPAQKRNMAD